VTSLPDWLVERAALDEVPQASRDRIDRADPRELADGIAALRADNANELAAYPAGPAVAQIDARVAAETRRRRRRLSMIGVLAGAAAAVVVGVLVFDRTQPAPGVEPVEDPDGIRVKGDPRLLAFRQAGAQVEKLEHDALVRAGDLIQLRYNGGGQSHGMIASIDGAGAVTLHFPASEDAPPEATTLAPKTTALPHAYALDDAPRFERFFFITAAAPIDVQHGLEALRVLARGDDSDTAALQLPAGLRQWSLRLRKPQGPSNKAPTP
jgi:hypothetical protein